MVDPTDDVEAHIRDIEELLGPGLRLMEWQKRWLRRQWFLRATDDSTKGAPWSTQTDASEAHVKQGDA